MGDKSAIEWTDATWTPLRARNRETGRTGTICVHKSAGCAICWSETMQGWRGAGAPYTPSGLKQVELYLDEKMLGWPTRWRAPRRIFVCSQTDLFGEWWPDEWVDFVFAVMILTQRHTYQVLTKRPERMRAYFDDPNLDARLVLRMDQMCGADLKDVDRDGSSKPPAPNVWLGVSVENQATADERIPLLLATPAAVRWVSYEPALGPVDFTRFLGGDDGAATESASVSGLRQGVPANDGAATVRRRRVQGAPDAPPESLGTGRKDHAPLIDWIVVGGESGPGARPFDLSWARSVARQSREAGVPYFFKQAGRVPLLDGERLKLVDPKGGDLNEWPEDLRVRKFPR